jgi:hypothetical protein
MSNQEVGGLIAIGIDDDGKHLPPPQDFSVLTAYNQEAIQQLVSKYASRKFEVEVIFVDHDTVTHPVIVVPPAAEMPIISRSAIGQGSCHASCLGLIMNDVPTPDTTGTLGSLAKGRRYSNPSSRALVLTQL